jgi:FkbM family methyltransferase
LFAVSDDTGRENRSGAAVNQALAQTAALALRPLYRSRRFPAGRRIVWNRLLRRFVLWRDIQSEATTRFGARMRVNLADTIQSYIYFFGVWEPAITAYLTTCLGPGDTVIDVGANIGYDTLLAAFCVGSTGHVFAVEASPSMFRELQANLTLNHVSNVTAVHAAACHHATAADVFLHASSNRGGSTIMPGVAARRDTAWEATVPAGPLPALVSPDAIRRARLIKIDVEGAEWPVIQGLRELLPQLGPAAEVLIEVNTEALADHGASPAALIDLFAVAGFRPFFISNGYDVDTYLYPPDPEPRPLQDLSFSQLDLLFRR